MNGRRAVFLTLAVVLTGCKDRNREVVVYTSVDQVVSAGLQAHRAEEHP